jgi:hypothetical protein
MNDEDLIRARTPYGVKIFSSEFYYENAESLYKKLLLLEEAGIKYKVLKREESYD